MLWNCFACALLALGILAETIDLQAIADTTLHSINPAHNMGGHTHVAVGVTAKNTAARGLFRFDLNAIPTNAVVTSARLTFTLPALNRPDPAGSLYALHRVLVNWGEGTKISNLGQPGVAGEATWNHSSLPTTWTSPGGTFAESVSGRNVLGPAPGEYSIESTANLVSDVQHWIHVPAENFGWLLKVEDESVIQTARQFASRETPQGARLHIEYSVGPAPELRFTSAEIAGTNIVMRFTGGQRTVVVERATDLTGSWEHVTETTERAFTNGITGSRSFYRMRIK